MVPRTTAPQSLLPAAASWLGGGSAAVARVHAAGHSRRRALPGWRTSGAGSTPLPLRQRSLAAPRLRQRGLARCLATAPADNKQPAAAAAALPAATALEPSADPTFRDGTPRPPATARSPGTPDPAHDHVSFLNFNAMRFQTVMKVLAKHVWPADDAGLRARGALSAHSPPLPTPNPTSSTSRFWILTSSVGVFAVAASVAFLATAKVANVQVPMIFKMAIGKGDHS